MGRLDCSKTRRPAIQKSRAIRRCARCGGFVGVRRGAFRAHNWGMRLCPGSWQLAPEAGARFLALATAP